MLFQQGANDGFHEGIGDTLALCVTPAYLKNLGLLDSADNDKGPSTPDEDGARQGRLPCRSGSDRQVALGRVLRQDAQGEYNEAWWALRTQYQGVAAPVARRRRTSIRARSTTSRRRRRTSATSSRASTSSSSTARSARRPGTRARSTRAPSTATRRPGRSSARCSRSGERPWPEALRASGRDEGGRLRDARVLRAAHEMAGEREQKREVWLVRAEALARVRFCSTCTGRARARRC